jgi:hypothetical protein
MSTANNCYVMLYYATWLHLHAIFFAGCLFGLLINPENGGIMFLKNVGNLLPDNTATHLKNLFRNYEVAWCLYTIFMNIHQLIQMSLARADTYTDMHHETGKGH